jgi:hypothetical protein
MKQVFLATSLQRRKEIYTSAGMPYCRCKHLTSQYVSVCCL